MSSTPGIMTPSQSSTRDGDLFNAQYDNASLIAQWQEALDRCQGDLRTNEVEIINGFRTPERLIQDLNDRQRDMNDDVVSKLITQLYPALNALRHLCMFFMASLPSDSIEVALFWGILHLVITGCLSSKTVLAQFVTMLNRIRQDLVDFGAVADSIEDRPELKYAVVELFVTLIGFWKEVVTINRKTRTGRITEQIVLETVLGLKPAFDSALAKVQESVQRVERLASLSQLQKETARRTQVNHDILAMVTSHEDATIKFPIFSLPPAPAFFFGREQELIDIQDHLDAAQPAQTLRTFAIYGLGGVGKTALALALANKYRAEKTFDAIFWISSETSAELRRSFSEIALRMELPRASRDMDSESNIMIVRNWLGKTDRKWLCIYDNVEDFRILDRCLPPGDGHVIFTMRAKHLAMQAPGTLGRLELNAFNQHSSLQLFEGLWKSYDASADVDAERADAQTLLAHFDGLPLGIEQVAAYISYRSWTVRQFAARYSKMAKTLLAKADGGRAPHTLATVWEVQFERVADTDASRLLGLMALLSPDSIPMSVFLADKDEVELPLGYEFCSASDELDEACDDLMRLALIKRRGPDLSVHRLVQTAFLNSPHGLVDSDVCQSFELAVRLVRKQFPVSGGSSPLWGRWDRCSTYYPHVLALASAYRAYKLDKRDLACADVLLDLWRDCLWYQYEIGDHQEAVELVNLAYNACRDKESLLYAYLRSHAGCIHYALNDMHSARECNLLALNIRKMRVDISDMTQHLELANSYGNTGMERYSEGFYEEALHLQLEALKIRSSYSGGQMYMANSNNHLGQIYTKQHRFAEAQKAFKAAEGYCLEVGSNSDFIRGFILYQWSNLELAKDNLTAAKELIDRAHPLLYDSAPTHMYSSSSFYKQGIILARQGHETEALDKLDQAMLIANYRKRDGAVARCLFAKSRIVDNSGSASDELKINAKEWRIRASTALLRLDMTSSAPTQDLQDETAYDYLVPGEER